MRSLLKKILIPCFVFAVSALALQACSADPNDGGCTPGSTQACTCNGMDTGVQVCQANHTYAQCTGCSMSSSSSGMVCMPAGYSVGTADTFATDGLYQIKGTSFVLGRDAGGFYAMSSLCTHQQCNMNSKGAIIAGGIHCNCHGAEFDANGNVTKGPAVKALKHYQVTLECDGNLWVDTSVVVAADQRVAV